jgi:translocation and assembly module TamB
LTRRIVRWTTGIAAALIALPVLTIAIFMVMANTGPGRRLIETETAKLTGGMVVIRDLTGRFPDALRAGEIQVSDAKGRYVAIHGLVLDWSPLKLLRGTARIDQLSATRIELSRLPESSHTTGSGGRFILPVRVDLRHLHVDQMAIDPPVMGAAATLTLNGSGDLRNLTAGALHLDAQRLGVHGRYAVDGTVAADHIQATLKVDEPANGLIATVTALPNLGEVGIRASVNGPRDALVTSASLTAGPLKASASGTVDLVHEAADLVVKVDAPAMTPTPGLSWDLIRVDATVHGPFEKPDATGTVLVRGLDAGGARTGTLTADVSGNAGQIRLHATAAELRLPGPKPDLLASAPIVLDASTQLDAPARPVSFTLHHPLLAIDGSAKTTGERAGQAHIVLPNLEPLAAAGGVDLQGHAALDLQAAVAGETTTGALAGVVAIIGGMAPLPELIGQDMHIDVAASMHGQDVTLSRLQVNGKALDASAKGGLVDQVVKLDWTARLMDLAAVQPDLSGSVSATGHLSGKTNDLAADAEVDADLAAKGYSSGHVQAHVEASGLPDAPRATMMVAGTLLEAPVSLDLAADRTDGTIHATINHATWRSLQAEGAVQLASGTVVPQGTLRINLDRLADLEPLLGQPIAGQAAATLDSDDRSARLSVTVRDATVAGTAVGRAALNVTVTDPAADATVDGNLTVDGVSAGQVKAVSARLTAKGTRDELALSIAADAPALFGDPGKLTAGGRFNIADRTLALASLEAGWRQQSVRLLAPAKIAFADGVSVDRLRLGLRQAELSVSGKAGDSLDLTATLRNLTADIASVADPSLAADGVIAGEAHLTGTSSRPEGTVKLSATGVHLRQGPAQGLPAADLAMSARLLGTQARLDGRLTAGQSHVAITGTSPLSEDGAFNLKADGQVNLAMFDPVLAARGRRVHGQVSLNAVVTGTTAAPRATGTAVLTNGSVTDYTIGAHVSNLSATLEASGDTIRLSRFSGRAGPGTLGGSGTIGLAGAMPVDLHLTADNARPVSSDLITTLIDANLTLQGEIKGVLRAGGTVHVRRADIRVPDKMPATVAVLPVRDPNAPPPPPPETSNSTIELKTIELNLTLNAPGQVFIRGRGLDAELGGTIHIRGTIANPVPDGGLRLIRGTLSVIGTTLNFTEGTISFSGAGISNPSLHFVATSATASITAKLTVDGSARDPKITLSSVPDLPQDEILSQLLFNTSTAKLNPVQLLQIAAALASLSGATSGVGDPLEKLRTTFGLDRLSIGSSSTGSPTLEAGRYLTRGVYLGARQAASGSGTQVTVQIDIAKGLKLETTAGSGTASATGSTSGEDAASVGLVYQFEY